MLKKGNQSNFDENPSIVMMNSTKHIKAKSCEKKDKGIVNPFRLSRKIVSPKKEILINNEGIPVTIKEKPVMIDKATQTEKIDFQRAKLRLKVRSKRVNIRTDDATNIQSQTGMMLGATKVNDSIISIGSILSSTKNRIQIGSAFISSSKNNETGKMQNDLFNIISQNSNKGECLPQINNAKDDMRRQSSENTSKTRKKFRTSTSMDKPIKDNLLPMQNKEAKYPKY